MCQPDINPSRSPPFLGSSSSRFLLSPLRTTQHSGNTVRILFPLSIFIQLSDYSFPQWHLTTHMTCLFARTRRKRNYTTRDNTTGNSHTNPRNGHGMAIEAARIAMMCRNPLRHTTIPHPPNGGALFMAAPNTLIHHIHTTYRRRSTSSMQGSNPRSPGAQ